MADRLTAWQTVQPGHSLHAVETKAATIPQVNSVLPTSHSIPARPQLAWIPLLPFPCPPWRGHGVLFQHSCQSH